MKLRELIENELQQRETGWWSRLCEMIPELVPLESTRQPREFHAEGNVAIHTRLAIEACPVHCDPDLPWVALLHDIGKAETTKENENGRITAHGHDKRGSELAEVILIKTEMPAERRRRIIWVIRYHMFYHAWQLESPEELTSKQRAYLKNPDFPLLLELLRIDSLASHGKTNKMQAYEFYHKLWAAVSSD